MKEDPTRARADPSEELPMNMRAYLTLTVAMFTVFLGLTVVSPLMSIYAKGLGASGIWLGIFFSSFSVSRTIFMPFTGWFSDRRGRKTIMIAGLILYCIVSILYNLAQNIYQLTLVRFTHGFASAMVIPVAAAYIGDICPKGKEGTYMGRFTMSEFIGWALGPLLGGTLATMWNIQSVFYVMTALVFLTLLMVVFLVPECEPQIKPGKTRGSSIPTMLKDNKVKAISMYMGSRALFRQSITAFLPLLIVETLGMTTATAGFVVSMYLLAGAVGQGLLGPMADKHNRKAILIFSSLIGPLPVFFLPQIGSVAGFLAILIPIAVVNAVSRATAAAYTVEAGKKYLGMGTVSGIVFAAQDAGQFIGPLISGYSLDNFGIGSVYIAVAIIGVISAFFVAYWLLKKETQVVAEAEEIRPS